MASSDRQRLAAAFSRSGRKRRPPRGNIYPPAVVPGYGDYIHERARRKIDQAKARNDRTTNSTRQQPFGPPPTTAPWRPGQRRPRRRTRPTPGSAYRNRNPTLN